MTKAMLELNLPCNDENGVEKVTKVKELFLIHPSIEAVERTAQSGEMGKYVIWDNTEREAAINEFIDLTCEFANNSKISKETKQHMYPIVRRTSNSKLASQIQVYANEILQIEEEEAMPNKPPN